MENSVTRNCLSCSEPLRGRSDKKFCDDYCRNQYNNQRKMQQQDHPLVRKILKSLLKNREILCSFLNEGQNSLRLNREELVLAGFQFRYATHARDLCSFCFDLGVMAVDADWVLVFRETGN